MSKKTYRCKVHGDVDLYFTIAADGRGPFCPECLAEWLVREIGELERVKKDPI